MRHTLAHSQPDHRGPVGAIQQKWRFANARPDFSRRSNRPAASRLANSIDTTLHGRFRAVWMFRPAVCQARRFATSLVTPT